MSSAIQGRPRVAAVLQPVPWKVWGQATIIVLGAFTSMLSSTITSTALPTIAQDLHAPLATTQWIATGYLLALAAGVPLSGWASRKVGATRLWLGSLILFCIFSVWCAASGTIFMLIVGRVLEGISGGLLVPAGQTISGIIAGRERLGRVMSTIGVAIVVAPTLGTTLGSMLFHHGSWAWLFWINIPLCALAFATGAKWLPQIETGVAGRLDWIGLLLAFGGLPLLTYGVTAISHAGGLRSTSADLCTACSAVLLILFSFRALRVSNPLLQLRLFQSEVFSSGAAIMFFGGAINFGAQVVLPLYFIQVRHESLLAAGLLIAPQVVGTAIGFPLAGWLTDRYGAGRLLLAGGAITGLATIPLAVVDVHGSYLWLGVVLLVRGFGVALGTIPAMTAGLAAISRDHFPDAAAILNMLQRTGASIGTAVIATLYSNHLMGVANSQSAVSAFRYANWWLFCGACLMMLPAYLLVRVERKALPEISM